MLVRASCLCGHGIGMINIWWVNGKGDTAYVQTWMKPSSFTETCGMHPYEEPTVASLWICSTPSALEYEVSNQGIQKAFFRAPNWCWKWFPRPSDMMCVLKNRLSMFWLSLKTPTAPQFSTLTWLSRSLDSVRRVPSGKMVNVYGMALVMFNKAKKSAHMASAEKSAQVVEDFWGDWTSTKCKKNGPTQIELAISKNILT